MAKKRTQRNSALSFVFRSVLGLTLLPPLAALPQFLYNLILAQKRSDTEREEHYAERLIDLSPMRGPDVPAG